METIAQMLRERADDDAVGLRFEDETWTWAQHVRACAERAAWLEDQRSGDPFHVGVLLDNVPEFSFLLGAGALGKIPIVGLNPTRRGAELAADITHTECRLVITEQRYLDELRELDLDLGEDRILCIDDERYHKEIAQHVGAPLPDVEVGPGDVFMLIFTSGTSGTPKAVVNSQGKIAFSGFMLSEMVGLTADDVIYASMPLFHSNAVIAGWTPALAKGTTLVLRRKFSASEFLEDVRRYGVTYANYVGKPLSYVLAQPERDDDADNPLRLVFGNEASERDIHEFARRFDCRVVDGFGSTEGGLHLTRDDDTPPGSIGKPIGNVAILNEAGEECPPAQFDDQGRILNAEDAIGEMVNLDGTGSFEGYYKNPEAQSERVRDGKYHSGDLAYRDENGYFYFAGRTLDWVRVDGENFAVAPVERILSTHPDVVDVAVYAVPDDTAGDQVMAALVLRDGTSFDPQGFADWLATQRDLGAKWAPRYVRVAERLPQTPTNKVRKRDLARERWDCDDPVFWRDRRDGPYRRLTPDDVEILHQRFAASGRDHLLSV